MFMKNYKTYTLSALVVLWSLIYVWKWIDITPELFLSFLTLLSGGTVWAMRSAIK